MEYENLNAKQYCMPSNYADNVKETNDAMGYHAMSDKANIAKQPQPMKAAKVDKQEPASYKFGY